MTRPLHTAFKATALPKQSSCGHLFDIFDAWKRLTLPHSEIGKVHEVGKAPCRGSMGGRQLLCGGMARRLFICLVA